MGQPSFDNRDVQVFLDRTKLRDFVNSYVGGAKGNDGKVVTLESSSTVGEAMKVLAKHGILSAPVIDSKTREYVGFVDMSDLLRGIMRVVYPELMDASFVEQHPKLSASELQTVGPDALQQPIAKLLHDNDLWFRGDIQSSLLSVVSNGFHIEAPRAGLGLLPSVRQPRVAHRVAVFDVVPDQATPDGPSLGWQVKHIISQSDVVRLIASHMDQLGPLFGRSVEELGLCLGAVQTLPVGVPALSAFAYMHHRKCSGLGLVREEGGVLLANLSVSDLRGLVVERFATLGLPAAEFLLVQRGTGLSWEDVLFGKHPEGAAEGQWDEVLRDVPLVTCSPKSSLADVIRSVVDASIHRIYVIDGQRHPVGVITLTDILRVLTT